MNYLVTIAPKLGNIREDMIQEILNLIRRDVGSFGHESSLMVARIKEKYLNCRFFDHITLILTSDQVVRIYSTFKKTDITSIKEQGPCETIDLSRFSKTD